QDASLKEARREFERATCLPTSLVERESEVTSLAKHAWASAREASDFSIFAPELQKILEISREKAELWGYSEDPYDALLETYERGATSASIQQIFDTAEPDLVTIARAASERSASIGAKLPAGPYPIEKQMAFNRRVAESFGFDFERGRIDTTTHPFCTTLGPGDVRLTTRYDEDDFSSSLFGVLHEAGHGLYEQGLLPEDFGTPAGSAVSLGIHESQSRLWENHVGRSRPFWSHWLPIAAEYFPQLTDLTLDDFLAAVHRVEFSYIRVEADEATYDLHILLRFKLERALISGDLQVADVPDAWNQAFQAAFGMTPPDDTHGCLQDIHWSMGGLGYFPTYTLGNFNAAQLFEAAMKDSDIHSAFKSANYAPLLAWLQTHVHQPGGTLSPSELIKTATGEVPSTEAHIAHLRRSYLETI
ncbi:MAG: carboxypeptidase M32, partial [Haloferula sp.]